MGLFFFQMRVASQLVSTKTLICFVRSLLKGHPFVNGPLWFLIALMWCHLLLKFIHQYSRTPRFAVGLISVMLYAIGVVILGLPLVRSYYIRIPMCIPIVPLAFLYFSLGFVLSKYVLRFCAHGKSETTLCSIANSLWAFLIMVMLACLVSRFPYVDFVDVRPGNPLVAPILAFAGIFSVLGISTAMIKIDFICKAFSWIGKNSLFFFALDFIAGRFVVRLLKSLGMTVRFPMCVNGHSAAVSILFFFVNFMAILVAIVPVRWVYSELKTVIVRRACEKRVLA